MRRPVSAVMTLSSYSFIAFQLAREVYGGQLGAYRWQERVSLTFTADNEAESHDGECVRLERFEG